MLRGWAWLVMRKKNKNKYNIINNKQIKNSLLHTMTTDIIAVVMVLSLSLFSMGKKKVS